MNPTRVAIVLGSVALLGLARPASAELDAAAGATSHTRRSMDLGLGVGAIGSGHQFSSGGGGYAGTGLGGELAVDLLVGRGFFRFGAYGSWAPFRARSTPELAVETLTLGLQAQVLFAPRALWRPYLSIGSGYRALIVERDGGRRSIYDGFQVARARVGLEYAFTSGASMGPVVGMDLTVFKDRRSEGTSTEMLNIVAPYYFAGISGRLDVLAK